MENFGLEKQDSEKPEKGPSRYLHEMFFPRCAPTTYDGILQNVKKMPGKAGKDWKYYRAERYRLQSIIRDWIIENKEYSKSHSRVVKCLHTRYKPSIEIAKKEQAFYRGLVKCGSVWACPVCSAKIQSVRREEIKKTVDWAYKNNHKCMMVTFTFPHYKTQGGSDLMERFSEALAYFRGGKGWQIVKEKLGFLGLIRGLEVLKGKNGWHIHTHELWIVSKQANMSFTGSILTAKWERAIEKQGLLPKDKVNDFRKHGVDIKDNAHASDYLAKSSWGVDAELTMGNEKVSQSQGVTPFALVSQGRKEEFLEYMNATKGRQQLYFSKGLKELVGLKEIDDKEIVEKEEMEDKIDVLALLNSEQWKSIVKNKARVKVLEIAETQGFSGIISLLRSFEEQEQADCPSMVSLPS